MTRHEGVLSASVALSRSPHPLWPHHSAGKGMRRGEVSIAWPRSTAGTWSHQEVALKPY